MKLKHFFLLVFICSMGYLFYAQSNVYEKKQDLLEQSNAQILHENSQLQNQVRQYENQIYLLNQSIEKANKEVSEYKAQARLLEEKIEASIVSIKTLEDSKKNHEKEILKLSEDIEIYQKELDALNLIIGDCEADIEALEMSLTTVNAAYQALQQKRNELEQEILLLKEEKSIQLEKIHTVTEQARESNILILHYVLPTEYSLEEELYIGSGTVYKQDEEYYYAITNHHVIDSSNYFSSRYQIRFDSGQEVEAEILATGDGSTDLAVIRFPISGEELPLTKIDILNTPDVGDFVFVVGNPSGLQNVVSTTKILKTDDVLNGVHFPVLTYDFSMDTSGNSGGAVLNIDGELVGIHTWSLVDDEDRKFAIPLSVVIDFLIRNHLTP